MTDVLITAGELADSRERAVRDHRHAKSRAYAAGHLPDAVNVHEIFTYLATSTPEGMQELKTKFADAFGKAGLPARKRPSSTTVDGFRLRPVLPRLLSADHAGLSQMKVLHGGFDAWEAAGLPVTTDVPRRCRRRSRSFRKPATS